MRTAASLEERDTVVDPIAQQRITIRATLNAAAEHERIDTAQGDKEVAHLCRTVGKLYTGLGRLFDRRAKERGK
jgi:hypothetical protein